MKSFKKILKEMDACSDAVVWVGRKGLEKSWETCKRSGWMLWLLDQINYDEMTLRRLACRMVRETPLADGRKVWDLLTDKRSRQAVIITEKYCDGKATEEERAAAGAAARGAAGAAAGAAAWAADWAADWAAARAADWDAARAAAGAAAWAADWAAAWAADWDAARAAAGAADWDAARAVQSDIIRDMVSHKDVKKYLKKHNN